MKSILKTSGKCSWFGGPKDTGVGPQEGLALIENSQVVTAEFRGLFLATVDTSLGLARQLNPHAFFCAMRWDYSQVSRYRLACAIVRVSTDEHNVVWCRPADWGPNVRTGRVIDLSWGALRALGLATDDTVDIEVLL